jgi:hypothetical protein
MTVDNGKYCSSILSVCVVERVKNEKVVLMRNVLARPIPLTTFDDN